MNFLQNNKTLFRVWNGTGAATILLPLIIFGVARLSNSQGNNNGEEENQNNNNNSCRWYQWNCSNNYNEQGEEGQRENTAPWWWFGANDRRGEDGGPSPALIVAYCWSLVMFCIILKMGYDGVINGQDRAVSASLIVFANLCFLMMILLSGVEGIVESDGPELEENGFYGQMGVLLYLSCFLWLLWSLTFVFLVRKRSQSNVTKIEIEPSDYQMHSDQGENDVQRGSDAIAV